MAAICSGSASSPTEYTASGPPGARCRIPNNTIEIATSVGTATVNRRPRYAIIVYRSANTQ
jgi:hypothetical protein